MKIRIGGLVFEVGQLTPVMLELTQQDKENIANMAPDATKYAVFPDDWGTPEEMRAWMRLEGTPPDVPTPAGPLNDDSE